jgi:glutamine amidotransferase
MCRFVFYIGPEMTLDMLTTRPRNSMIHQSYQAEHRSEPLNGDGFGIAWYPPEDGSQPAVFRSIQPAWNNMNLGHIARVTKSSTVLAHVRAASPGLPVMQTNCHPFTAGRLAFCHNGYVAGFGKIKRALRTRLSDTAYSRIEGSTDSEHIFALILDRLEAVGEVTLQSMREAMHASIREVLRLCAAANVREPCQLNLALTDGVQAVACRFSDGDPAAANTLFVHAGRAYTCDEGVCRMLDADAGQGSVLVASEPLSDDPGWETVPVGAFVTVDADRRVAVERMTFDDVAVT